MKKHLCLLLLFACSVHTFAQNPSLSDFCQVFHLPFGKDTTTFVVFGTKEDLEIKKPLFVFRQGSQPRPLLTYEDGKYYSQLPFSIKPYQNDYHFVMIQKIGTQFLADSAYLAGYEEGMRSGSSKYLTPNYQKHNNLDVATEQCNQVINFLVKQKWVDTQKVVFCGGSEGFTIGANLVANYNKHITHTILFSGHTGRRFESLIFDVRKAEQEGKISSEAAQKEIENLYNLWVAICKHPKDVEKNIGDTYYAWHSFSVKSLDNLLKIKSPLYIAYGTEDREITSSLDNLPLEFIEKGKKNLTLKAYSHCNHQFFELKKDANGKIIEQLYRGDEVAKDWMEWLKNKP